MGETKVIYHLDDQETPYLVKLPIPAERVTLLDLKNALKKPNYKFFFKSMDDDFGWAYCTLVFFSLLHVFLGFNAQFQLFLHVWIVARLPCFYRGWYLLFVVLLCVKGVKWTVCVCGVQKGWMLGSVQLTTASILRLDCSQTWPLACRHELWVQLVS